jgi:hypothetical protein
MGDHFTEDDRFVVAFAANDDLFRGGNSCWQQTECEQNEEQEGAVHEWAFVAEFARIQLFCSRPLNSGEFSYF